MNNPQPKELMGKGFKKGDPRINRSGRPRSFDELRRIAQRIAVEKVIDAAGNSISRIEQVFRQWSRSKQPALQMAFVAYGYGKPPEKIELDGLEPKTRLILHFAHEFDEGGQLRPKRAPLPPDPDGVHRQWRRDVHGHARKSAFTGN